MTAQTLLGTLFEHVHAQPPSSGIDRSETVATGLPRGTFTALAKALGASEKRLALVLAVPCPGSKAKTLDLDTSEGVYGLVAALCQLQAKLGGPVTDGFKWLQRPCPQLKGRIPVALLRTGIGGEYVGVAISRLGVA